MRVRGNGYSAVVTGASRGIGRAIAKKMHDIGYAVVINYAGSRTEAESLAAEIGAEGGKALCVRADVSDLGQVQEMIKAAEAFAPIGALINNAGITRDALIMRMSAEDFDRVLDVNLKGGFYAIRQAAPLMMRRRKGSIVNISSVVAAMGNVGQANYVAAKAGLIGLTKTAARELATRGVTVNAVLPGFVRTDMTDDMTEAAREKMLSMVPMGRAGTAQEIAGVVAFLCGEDARYITGHEFYVDGGLVM